MAKKRQVKNPEAKIKISYNKTLLVLMISAAVLLFLCIAIIKYYSYLPAQTECKIDSDCTKQRLSCCSCKMGGEDVCMSRNNATVYESKLTNSCDGVMCTAVFNCKQTKCSCRQSKCVEE